MRSPHPWIFAAPLLACLVGCSGARSWRARAPSRDVTFGIAYRFTSEGETSKVRVVVLVPKSLAGRQLIRELRLAPQPLRVFDVGENRYAEFLFREPPASFQVQMTGTATLYRYDVTVARRGRPPPADDLARCLVAEPSLEKDDPAVTVAASGLHGESELDTVRRVYDFVRDTMTHGGFDPSSTGGGAVRALRRRKGDCTDYADLMVALCRARGIPARHVLGLYAAPGNDVPQHSWVEVYTKELGWVPFDPTVDDCTGNASFDTLGPSYIVFSTLRNDETLDGYHAYAVYRWWGDRVTLAETYEVK